MMQVKSPFKGGETEEVYVKLFEMGCDGYSTDYPSVMVSAIRKLKAKYGPLPARQSPSS